MNEMRCSIWEISRNKGSYILLLILCGLEIISSVQTHSLIARLALCDTILFSIAMSRKLMTKTSEILDVFLHLAGLIAFEALIFVNFTHGIEILFTHSHEMEFPGKKKKTKNFDRSILKDSLL